MLILITIYLSRNIPDCVRCVYPVLFFFTTDKTETEPTENVGDDIANGLFDAFDGRLEESFHCFQRQSDHSLRRPSHVLVAVLVDCRLHLATLSVTRRAVFNGRVYGINQLPLTCSCLQNFQQYFSITVQFQLSTLM